MTYLQIDKKVQASDLNMMYVHLFFMPSLEELPSVALSPCLRYTAPFIVGQRITLQPV